jgi:hypothetical protein
VFSLLGNPHTIDLGTKAQVLPLFCCGNVRNVCFIPTIMDHSGNLREMPTRTRTIFTPIDGGPEEDKCSKFHDYEIIPEPDVPFSMIEEKMRGQKPSSLYRLRSARYRFLDPAEYTMVQHARPGLSRLYYSTMVVTNGSQLVQLAGSDPEILPPKFEIDHKRIAGFLDSSKHKSGAVFFCTLFVDENGSILGVDGGGYLDKPPELIEALAKTHVTIPGMRDGVPVPTAVILSIPVK